MPGLIQIEAGDRQLLGEVADVMAEAARRSGEWVVCRLGCTQCCFGPFAITQLDALRLQEGMAALEAADAVRARAVRARAASYVAAMGELFDDLACPALDPDTGGCDLYESRPITCRTFGPATKIGDDSLAACELCYVGATDEEIARCAVEVDPEDLEGKLVAALEAAGVTGATTVAHAIEGGPEV